MTVARENEQILETGVDNGRSEPGTKAPGIEAEGPLAMQETGGYGSEG